MSAAEGQQKLLAPGSLRVVLRLQGAGADRLAAYLCRLVIGADGAWTMPRYLRRREMANPLLNWGSIHRLFEEAGITVWTGIRRS